MSIGAGKVLDKSRRFDWLELLVNIYTSTDGALRDFPRLEMTNGTLYLTQPGPPFCARNRISSNESLIENLECTLEALAATGTSGYVLRK